MGVNELLKVGYRLKKIRQEAKISQKEMANRIGIPYSTYSNYENNNREPSLDVLNRFCQIMDISILDLLDINEISEKRDLDKEETFLSLCNYLGYTVFPVVYKGYVGYQITKEEKTHFIDNDTFLGILDKVTTFAKFNIEESLKTADVLKDC